MISIQADDQWLVRDLGHFVEPVEITDTNGKLLGLFVPANLEQGKQTYARLAAQMDWAEIERRRKSNERRYTTAEVQSFLKQLEQECNRRKGAGERELTPDEAVAFVTAVRNATPGQADLAG